MIITITGYPGSGNSTIAEKLAKKLNYKLVRMGTIMRNIAKEKNITLNELQRIGETEKWVDEEVDKHQKELNNQDKLVVDGKLSFYFIPKSIKIKLNIDPIISAKRVLFDVLNNKRKSEIKKEDLIGLTEQEKIEKIEKEIKKRYESNKKRYKKYYGIDIDNPKNYDLIIDTTNKTPEEITKKILEYIKNKDI